MSGQLSRKVDTLWDAFKAGQFDAASCAAIDKFAPAVSALMNSDEWTKSTADVFIHKGVVKGVLYLYSVAPTAQAIPLAHSLYHMVYSFGLRAELLANDFGSVLMSRMKTHLATVSEVTMALCVLFSFLCFVAPSASTSTSTDSPLSFDPAKALSLAAQCLYPPSTSPSSPLPGTKARCPKAPGKADYANDNNDEYDDEYDRDGDNDDDKVESKSTSDEVDDRVLLRIGTDARGEDSTEPDAYSIPPQNTRLSEQGMRVYLWCAFTRVAHFVIITAGMPCDDYVLDTMLYALGTRERLPVFVRQASFRYLTTLAEAPATAESVVRWLLRGGRRHLVELAARLPLDTGGPLFVLEAIDWLTAYFDEKCPSKAPPLASLGLTSAATLRGVMKYAVLPSPKSRDAMSRLGKALVFALKADRTSAATAIIDSDALSQCFLFAPEPADNDDAAAFADSIWTCTELAYRFFLSGDPRAFTYGFKTGMLHVALDHALQGLLFYHALNVRSPSQSVVSVAAQQIPRLTAVFRALAAAQEGQRRADAAHSTAAAVAARTSATAAAPAVRSPNQMTVGTRGGVDWSSLPLGPGGAKAVQQRKWREALAIAGLWTEISTEKSMLVAAHNVLGCAQTGMRAVKEGVPYATLDKLEGTTSLDGTPLLPAGPINLCALERVAEVLKAVKGVCPAAEALTVMFGGVPYAKWGDPEPFPE